ncbi:MAG: GNAT family protein [Candidatus Curtissbacteria bacterium]|nr:GNAT family protein [Candidatus Curtissbacteria bacterium]
MKNVFLEGEHIYLRGLTEEDLKGNYVSWLNDEKVCEFNSHHVFPYSVAEGLAYINASKKTRDAIVLAIILKGKEIHIGNIALQGIDYTNKNAEFAIIVGEQDYWNKGYSKEASLLLVKHGFSEMNLHRIYCGTSQHNIGMQKLAKFLGMKEEGRLKEQLYKHGSYADILKYGVLKKDFCDLFGIKI